jgi:parvulin-like peptidyl-prolyl isomerase
MKRRLVAIVAATWLGFLSPLASEATAQVAAVAVDEAQFEMDASVFDQWVFGNHAVMHTGSRRTMDSQIELWMNAIDAVCRLTDQQRLKLRLAAKGDVAHFMQDVEVVRAKFMLVRKDQDKVNEIYQEIQPLAARFQRGVFGEDSLLQKVVSNTLDDEQAEKWREAESRRREFHFRTRVEHIVLSMGHSLALSEKQRDKLIELLLDRTEPMESASQYEFYLMMYRLSEMPQDELKPLFDDPQWASMKRQLQQAKSLEPFLKSQGLLE